MTESLPPLDANSDLPLFEAVEHLPVTILESAVLAVRRQDGTIFLAIRDLCAATQLVFSSQLRRIRNNPVLHEGLVRCRVATTGGIQEQLFLELELVPTWLLMINTRTSSESMREKLRHFQRYIIREVYTAFGRFTGLPESSRQIEDLDDLRQIDTALNALAERQSTLETSQEQARGAWRDLSGEIRSIAARLNSLEQKVGNTISREQRGTIYQLVQAWGKATAAANERLSTGSAMASCWAALKRRYKLARYEDLPVVQYDDCVAFIRTSYRKVTGEDLDLPEQQPLSLE